MRPNYVYMDLSESADEGGCSDLISLHVQHQMLP